MNRPTLQIAATLLLCTLLALWFLHQRDLATAQHAAAERAALAKRERIEETLAAQRQRYAAEDAEYQRKTAEIERESRHQRYLILRRGGYSDAEAKHRIMTDEEWQRSAP